MPTPSPSLVPISPFALGHDGGVAIGVATLVEQFWHGGHRTPVVLTGGTVGDAIENGLTKEMSVLLKQFELFTSGTSSSGANVMSTH